MHPYLRTTIERFEVYFFDDNRCLGMYLDGSGGLGTDDEYSDVDIALVVRDEHYEELSAELYSVCEKICGKIHLWFPEGKREEFCNYAFLFEANAEQFLYDFAIVNESFFRNNEWLRPSRILFDHVGMLRTEKQKRPEQKYVPDNLEWIVKQYWLYAYLNGKYYKRGDVYKLIYMQRFLFDVHVQALNALHPDEKWTWWARDINKLPRNQQEQMMIYFGATDVEAIAKALQKEVDIFSHDAKQAMEKWDRRYPQQLEDYVRRHLETMEVF